MPNWFYNELVITGEKQELQRFKIAALGRYPWATDAGVLCFNSLVPIPPPVLESSYNDWTRANWGCKFGGNAARLEKETESELFYWFETANGPPEEFLRSLGRLWPNLKFSDSYVEFINCRLSWCFSVHGDDCKLEPSSLKDALVTWAKEAAVGDDEAQYNLGVCYARGFGVVKSLDTAIGWWAKSAAQGYGSAVEAITDMANWESEEA